jgi:hypothetical protein
MGRRNTFLKFTLRNLKTNKANMRCIHLTSAEIGLEMKKARGRTGLSDHDRTYSPTSALIVPKSAVKNVALEQLRLILRKDGTN